MTAPTSLHPLLTIVTFIVLLNNGHNVGTASGFFYKTPEHSYFVTARHVVQDYGARTNKVNALKLVLHADKTDYTKHADLEIRLQDRTTGARKYLMSNQPALDLIAVPIDDVDLSPYVINWVSESDALPERVSLMPGESVIVPGFPFGVGDSVYALPLFKSGTVATAYGIPFRGNPEFLIDCNLQEGMSGSPVFANQHQLVVLDAGNSVTMTAPGQYFFLGVHTDTKGSVKGVRNLGVSNVIYAKHLRELIRTAKLGGMDESAPKEKKKRPPKK